MKIISMNQAIVILRHYRANIGDFVRTVGRDRFVDLRDLSNYLGLEFENVQMC